MPCRPIRFAIAMLLACGTLLAAHAQTIDRLDTPLGRLLNEATRMLRQGEAASAHELLEPRASLYAGSVEFDMLLGIAALDAGRPGRAVLALERVLAVEPNNLQARAEIARAYLQLRELETARREFESVARSELPPPVRETVQRYLDTVARLERAGRPQWTVEADLSVGWDDNVNYGSAVGQWILADGQALTPLPVSRPRGSGFVSIGASAQYVAPIGGRLQWTAGAQVSQRSNPAQHNMDLGSVEFNTGLAHQSGAHRYSMSVQFQHLRLDDSAFRNAAGAVVQWQHDAGPRTQVGLYGQAFDLRFADQSVRDAARHGAGVTLAHGFSGPWRPVVAASAYAGREASKADLPQLSFDFAGLRAVVGMSLSETWQLSAGWSYEHRAFDGPEPLFGATRVDHQHDLRLAFERPMGRRLTISPTLLHTRNRSSLAPSDFNRTQFLLYARYRF